jgi:Family of unknown function (DUF6235)
MTNDPERILGRIAGRRNQLNAGLDVLDTWSETASQAARNALYRALFAVTDGSVFRFFQTSSHRARPDEVTIYLRADLVVTISQTEADLFDIAYIGPLDGAPGTVRDRD